MLLLDWLEESEFKFPGACGYTGSWMAELIAKQAVLIVEDDSRLLGVLGLRESHFPWNNQQRILVDDCFMVARDVRNLGVADMLMEAAKDLAKETKTMLMFGHFTGKRPELKDRFIQKHGFIYAGGTFFYDGR